MVAKVPGFQCSSPGTEGCSLWKGELASIRHSRQAGTHLEVLSLIRSLGGQGLTVWTPLSIGLVHTGPLTSTQTQIDSRILNAFLVRGLWEGPQGQAEDPQDHSRTPHAHQLVLNSLGPPLTPFPTLRNLHPLCHPLFCPWMEQVALRPMKGSLWKFFLFKLCSPHPEATGAASDCHWHHTVLHCHLAQVRRCRTVGGAGDHE